MIRHLTNALFIVCIILIFYTNCNFNKTKEEANQKATLTDTLGTRIITVINDSVPVYSAPGGGNLVMKLNAGTKCKIVSKGIFEILDNFEDYWYLVDFEGKQGWIFGSKTSLKKNSAFDVFLRVFSNASKEILSDNFSKTFLNGLSGFIPLEYKKLTDERYAALFYKESKLQEVEILLIIYESGVPSKNHTLFKGTIKDCLAPLAFFTSKEYIKLVGPTCKGLLPSIMYFQIMANNQINELKSSITAKTSDELLLKIKEEQKIANKSLSDECKCIVNSSVKIGYSNKDIFFYNILSDECAVFCNSSNYSLIAMPDSAGWFVKFEEKGVFHAIYESGLENKFIVILEEIKQKHLVEKISIERVFLLDVVKQTMEELNLRSESCFVIAPEQYGCDYCLDHSTHQEELIFRGNPVQQVVKKVANLYYDDTDICKIKQQNSFQNTYKWVADKKMFELE